jgi:hypothetical protein
MENNQNDIQNKTNLVFHYTSQAGLLGILAQKAIWASNVQYLNDSAEFKYAIGLADEEFKSIRELASPEDLHFLDEVHESVQESYYSDVFVCSFSEVGDLLSQWRGFCPPTGGFSVGFDISFLTKSATRVGSALAKCIYDQEDQKNRIHQLWLDTLKVCQSARAAGAPPLGIGTWTLNYFFSGSTHMEIPAIGKLPPSEGFNVIAPLLKHPSYSEEREWRVVLRAHRIKKPMFRPWKFREGKSAIVPYVLFDIEDPSEHPIIRQVIIGPTPFPELAYHSLQDLIRYENIQGCSLSNSGIPYRG